MIEISGAYHEMSRALARWLTRNDPRGQRDEPIYIKPFCCPLCMTWWCGLAYLAIAGHLTLFNVFILSMVAFLTPRMTDFYHLIDTLLTLILHKLWQKKQD